MNDLFSLAISGLVYFLKELGFQIPTWAVMLVGFVSIIALLIAIFKFFGWFISLAREQIANPKSRLSRVAAGTRHNLIPLMLGMMGCAGLILVGGAVAGTLAYLNNKSSIQAANQISTPNKEEFLKDVVLTSWADAKHPLMFLGTPTLTTDRLRVVVEYSHYRSGWTLPVRFELDPIKEPIKGKRFTLPVAHTSIKQNGGLEDLWWGTDPKSDNVVTSNPVYDNNSAATLTRGRIVIVGPDNKEQNAIYFEIVRGLNDQSGNVRFMILQDRAVSDWASEWEKET